LHVQLRPGVDPAHLAYVLTQELKQAEGRANLLRVFGQLLGLAASVERDRAPGEVSAPPPARDTQRELGAPQGQQCAARGSR
jgi:hypothetical protein